MSVFSRRGIRPPGAPRSIRPPRQLVGSSPVRPATADGRPTTPTRPRTPVGSAPRSSRGLDQPPRNTGNLPHQVSSRGRSRTLTAGIIAVAAVVIVCASVFGDRFGSATEAAITPSPASPTPRTVSAVVEPPAQTGCSTTAVLDTPADPTGWAEEWRLDTGRGDLQDMPSWQAYSAGDCLIIASRRYWDTPAQVTGYHLTSTGAEELWTRSGDDPDGEDINRLYPGDYAQWWGGYLVTGRLLLDPSTGDLTRAPWDNESGVVIAIADELAITCSRAYSRSAATCSAWDWNEGNPSQRWKQNYKEDVVNPATGYGMSGNVQDGSLVAQVDSDSENTRTYTLMSLADGSLHGNWPASSTNASGFPVFIPARDGWLRLSESQDQAALITSGGEEGQAFPVVGELPTVLLADGELPMLAQLRAAYRDGDFDWADVVLQCRGTSACTLNGNEVDLSESVLIDTYLQGGYYQRMAALTADGRSLIIRSRPSVSAWAIVLNTESGEVLVPEYSQDRSKSRALVRTTDDLILMIVGSEVIAYTPS